MLAGARDGDNQPQGVTQKAAAVQLSELNFGAYPTVGGISRLALRHLAAPERVEDLKARIAKPLDAAAAEAAGLVTFTPDDIDWNDEVRVAIEERAALSGDALSGMEANLRFAGPETAESKIFARLSAWQNWIFQRPNATGAKGALQVYGSGQRAEFDKRRV
jgi:benzoyl-CoA-dihydrodiol lyase